MSGTLAALLRSFPEEALACAVCFGGEGSVVKALSVGVVLMIGAVFLVLAGIVAWVLRMERRASP